MVKTKIIPISDVKIDKDAYPRMAIDFVTTARYYNALRSGAVFPPISVAKIGNEILLVDGAHRLKAHKDCKETHISVEILPNLKNKKQVYVEAIKRNIGHGRQFSTQEVTGIMITLEKWNLSQKVISEIVRIPANEIKPFIAKRMARITETQEDIALKAPLQHLAGLEFAEEINQGTINNRTQIALLDSLITLLENQWIDTTSEVIIEKLQKVYKLARAYKL